MVYFQSYKDSLHNQFIICLLLLVITFNN